MYIKNILLVIFLLQLSIECSGRSSYKNDNSNNKNFGKKEKQKKESLIENDKDVKDTLDLLENILSDVVDSKINQDDSLDLVKVNILKGLKKIFPVNLEDSGSEAVIKKKKGVVDLDHLCPGISEMHFLNKNPHRKELGEDEEIDQFDYGEFCAQKVKQAKELKGQKFDNDDFKRVRDLVNQKVQAHLHVFQNDINSKNSQTDQKSNVPAKSLTKQKPTPLQYPSQDTLTAKLEKTDRAQQIKVTTDNIKNFKRKSPQELIIQEKGERTQLLKPQVSQSGQRQATINLDKSQLNQKQQRQPSSQQNYQPRQTKYNSYNQRPYNQQNMFKYQQKPFQQYDYQPLYRQSPNIYSNQFIPPRINNRQQFNQIMPSQFCNQNNFNPYQNRFNHNSQSNNCQNQNQRLNQNRFPAQQNQFY